MYKNEGPFSSPWTVSTLSACAEHKAVHDVSVKHQGLGKKVFISFEEPTMIRNKFQPSRLPLFVCLAIPHTPLRYPRMDSLHGKLILVSCY
jgi:hypothetical protein